MYAYRYSSHNNSNSSSDTTHSNDNDDNIITVGIGYSAEGGAVGGGVQWMGVVLYSKTAYNIM